MGVVDAGATDDVTETCEVGLSRLSIQPESVMETFLTLLGARMVCGMVFNKFTVAQDRQSARQMTVL